MLLTVGNCMVILFFELKKFVANGSVSHLLFVEASQPQNEPFPMDSVFLLA